jgi:hypothetical protein
VKPYTLFLFFLFALLVFGTGFFLTRRMGPSPQIPAPIARADGATPRDATYEIDGESVTLHGGVYEAAAAPDSAEVVSTRYFGNEAVGDLNADGKDDTAFILRRTGAGSGTFYYLTAALTTESGYQGLNAILLGDRIAPQQTDIREGVIAANYVVRADGEPMTATSTVATTTYAKVVDGRLIQVADRAR